MITVGLLVVAVISVSPCAKAQWKTHWSYEGATGAKHWSELDPEYAACSAGKEQSPIDIRNAEKAKLPAIRFEYKSGPLKYLVDNGYTLRVNYRDAPANGNFLVVGDERYQLTQFHFHRPSEEYINGKPYDMVLHLMHQGMDGRIAGVAVLLKAGKSNPAIQQLWEHWPKTEGQEQAVAGISVNPLDLLPRSTAYYTYVGSLTAPPCTEGVTWFVLKTPLEISADQITEFAKRYPHDVRPIQPLNGRAVKESQ